MIILLFTAIIDSRVLIVGDVIKQDITDLNFDVSLILSVFGVFRLK